MDHAGAFGDAVHDHVGPARADGHPDALRPRVGRQHPGRAARPVGDDESDVEALGHSRLHPRAGGARPKAPGQADLFHGQSGSASRPMVSGWPKRALKFWSAEPAAPFTRLSSAPNATSRAFSSSTTACTKHQLLPSAAFVAGKLSTTRTNGSSA